MDSRNRDESAINGRRPPSRNLEYYELLLERIPGFEPTPQDLKRHCSYLNTVVCESGGCSTSPAFDEAENISEADQESFHIPRCNGNIDLEGYFETQRQQMDLIEENCIRQQNLIQELLKLAAAEENPEAQGKETAQPSHEGLVSLPFHRNPKMRELCRQIDNLAHSNIFANHKLRQCRTSLQRAFKGRGSESDFEDFWLEKRAHHHGSCDDNEEAFGELNSIANRRLVSVGDTTMSPVISRWDDCDSPPRVGIGDQFASDDLTVKMQTATSHRFLAAGCGIKEIRRRDLQDVLSYNKPRKATPTHSLSRILPEPDPKLSARGDQAQLDQSEWISTWRLGLSQYNRTRLLRRSSLETANPEQYILVPRQSDHHVQQPIGEG